MSLQNINPSSTKAWGKLTEHFKEIEKVHLKNLFATDSGRADKFTIEWQDFLVDFSKNRINEKTLELLLSLAEEVSLKDAIQKCKDGERINATEDRAVLHTALRAKKSASISVDGKNIMPEVHRVKEQIKLFAEALISGEKKGYTGKPFTDIVNIGIGGSDLGPSMATKALEFYRNHLKVHFVSNVDGDHVHGTLKGLDPRTTLFVIVSKTFTTQETLSNATTIKKWFLSAEYGTTENDIAKHFVAVSTNVANISKFGIASENVFPMWNWVCGRFSLWSAVGLSVALAVGYDNFEELLMGANEMDLHFETADFNNNIPVVLALLGIWNNNFFGAETEAIIPYTQYLSQFPSYLQQAIMESNGKSIDRNGEKVNYQTAAVVWGGSGTNSQHAFFQLIHQGTKLIPADFIGYKKPLYGDKNHHNKLMGSFFAQTEALLNGKCEDEVACELKGKNLSRLEIEKLLPFKVFEGNSPTNTILIKKLTPKTLGALIALYEHKIFVQGIVWNIYSFDQWGVELGKQLATTILRDLEKDKIDNHHDSSTLNLLQSYMS